MNVRVLVVEDEFMIGLDIGQQLTDAGFEVVGPAPSVAKALIAEPGCDVAILDINLGSETSEPVAEKLRASGKPFVVLTGYSMDNPRPWFHDVTILKKPPRIADLLAALRACVDVMPSLGTSWGDPDMAPPLAPQSGAKQSAAKRPHVSHSELGLTERQLEVLALMMVGKPNKAICRALNLAEPTVKNHVTAILKALEVTNRTEAVVAVGELGWELPHVGKS